MSDNASQINDEHYDDVYVTVPQSNGSGIKKKNLLFILPLLLLVSAGVNAFFSGIFDEEKHEAAQTENTAASSPVQISFIDLPEMLVNLNTTGSRPKFMKVQISLEIVSNNDTVIALGKVSPRIVDILQVYLRELRIDDLRDKRNMEKLQRELLFRLKTATRTAEIRDIVFRNILIQ